MKVLFFQQRTVQKGKGIGSMAGVQARLRQVAKNPKSSYHKALMEGRIQVHQIVGSKYPRWDIIEVFPVIPDKGTELCGACGERFFSIEEDYLCDDCRLQTIDP